MIYLLRCPANPSRLSSASCSTRPGFTGFCAVRPLADVSELPNAMLMRSVMLLSDAILLKVCWQELAASAARFTVPGLLSFATGTPVLTSAD